MISLFIPKYKTKTVISRSGDWKDQRPALLCPNLFMTRSIFENVISFPALLGFTMVKR